MIKKYLNCREMAAQGKSYKYYILCLIKLKKEKTRVLE